MFLIINIMLLTAYRELKTFGKIFLSKYSNRKFLLSTSFVVTNRCNSRCNYCNSYNIKSDEMDTRDVFRMIDEFSALGIKRMGFTGGEPLLREDIGNIISYTHEKGITTTLFSNGALIPKKIGDLEHLDLLLLSLDGPPQLHDSIRGMNGSFEHVLSAIHAAREVDLPVWINTVITKANVDQLSYLVNFALQNHVKIMFMPVFNYTLTAGQGTIDDLSAHEWPFKTAIHNLITHKKKGAPIVNSTSYFRYILENWPDSNHLQCKAGFNFCAVGPNGMVYPCHYLIGSDCGADGRKIGFRNAFESLKIPKCKGCFGNAYVDLNLFIEGNLNVILNTLKHIELRKRA